MRSSILSDEFFVAVVQNQSSGGVVSVLGQPLAVSNQPQTIAFGSGQRQTLVIGNQQQPIVLRSQQQPSQPEMSGGSHTVQQPFGQITFSAAPPSYSESFQVVLLCHL